MKISYQSTYTFSSLDIFDNADSEPITYEVHARQSPEWAELCRKWIKGGSKNINQALEIISLAFISVSQNGEQWSLDSIEAARALRDAVESDNPDHGDTFIKHLALGHWNFHFVRLDDRLKNLRTPSARSADGNGPEM